MSIGWLDCASGASGDMLLGVLVDAGVPVEYLQAAIDAVSPEPVVLRAERVTRSSLAAIRVHVDGTESHVHRTWADLRELLGAATVPGIDRALATFRRLCEAEGRVHGISADEVHLHEVGALDAIADIVGVCAGFARLELDRLLCSPVALGGGSVRAAHGRLAVPGPAVVELMRAAPSYGGPVEVELLTPTGAALLTEWVDEWGPAPLLTDTAQAFGAGGRDLDGHPNVVRLITGQPWQRDTSTRRTGPEAVTELVELQATVDDLDPRVWSAALEAIVEAGALDAWLAPALLRKGRPGQVLHALTDSSRAEPVRTAMVTQTSTLGVRGHLVERHAVPRTELTVTVDGQPIRVKVRGTDQRAQPEWDDVVAAATTLGRPALTVLDDAIRAARA